MSRVVDWPERLFDTVGQWEAVPFAWGSTDCLGFALACIKAVRGSLPIEDLPAYSDAKEARRVLRDMGARELENALMMHFEPVPVSMAQRGDIGISRSPEGEQAVVVCLGSLWRGKTQVGSIQLPRQAVERAFRV